MSALERPEARERLQAIQSEQGDRWPVLAGCQLWLLELHSHNFDAADQIFETLASRHRFDQLVSLVPSEVRNDILTAYRIQGQGFSFYKRDPGRVSRLRRAVEVENLLADIDVGYQNGVRGSRWSLLRCLEEAGQFDEALALAQQMVADAPLQGVFDDSCWLLSLRGRAQEALDQWVTPRGREAARKIAFCEVPMADFVRLPAMVMVTEFLKRQAFGGQWNQEQEQITWDAMQDTATQYYAGDLDAVKAGALGLAWKGQMWSWNRVARSLPKDYRARLAYILAHHYLGRRQADDARSLLQTAIDDSPGDSSLHALAAEELMALSGPQ